MKSLLVTIFLSIISLNAMAKSSALKKVESECARPALIYMQKTAKYYDARLNARTLRILTSNTYHLDGLHIVFYSAYAYRGSEKIELTALARRSIYKNHGDCALSQ